MSTIFNQDELSSARLQVLAQFELEATRGRKKADPAMSVAFAEVERSLAKLRSEWMAAGMIVEPTPTPVAA